MSLVYPGLLDEVCHCVAHGLHHPHLCLRHPDYAAALMAPASLVVAAWFVLAAPRLVGLVTNVWVTERWAWRVSKAPERVFDTIRFHLVDAPGLGACTTGLFRQRIAIDETLWHRLNDDERGAVLHHEDAHRQRRDPLTLLVLRACSAFSVLPRTAKLVRLWQMDTETECDRHAADATRSADSVAAALLSIERYHREMPLVSPPIGANAGGSELEERVRALLADNPCPQRANLASDVFGVALIGFVVAVATMLVAGDLIHHGAETALGLFLHHH
ncbi:MAG TPA: M56 family metallopeptidase [Polyangiaceae bacterium]